MTQDERRSAILPLFGAENGLPHPRRTYICLGVPRGGTSAVAGTMQRLGIFMGHDLPNNYEDPDFIAGRGPAQMKDTIRNRNTDHAIWGWKFPNAANYLEGLHGTLRNPCLILVWRDLAATVKGHLRWHNRATSFAAHDILIQQQKNWFLIERWRVPTLLISYEKAMLAPAQFVRDFARHLHLPDPSEEELKNLCAFLSPGTYK